MHVVQLLFLFLFIVDLEGIVLWLPETLAFAKFRKVGGSRGSIPVSELETAHPFPAVNESGQLSCRRKPNESMHMVGHQNKAHTLGLEGFQLMIEDTQHDSFRLVQIQ